MDIQIILAGLFFVLYSIYLFMGVAILEVLDKSNLNKLFVAICFCLAIWSLGFAVTVVSPTAKIALMWSRFAAIGWTMIYAVLLHFTIVLTGALTDSRIKKFIKNKVILIYIPALICLYVFALSPSITKSTYILVKTSFGWINLNEISIWNNIFYVYYLVYIITSVIMMILWGKRDLENKRKVEYIFSAMIVALVFGSLTDVVLIQVAEGKIPQLGPLFVLGPIIAAFASIKKFNLLQIESLDEQELVLGEKIRSRMYTFLASYLIFSSIVNAWSYTDIYGNNSSEIALMSIGLMLSGITILVVKSLRISNAIKDNIIIFIVYIFIHISALYSVNRSATTTWAAPVIIVILFVIFNNKRIIGFLTTSIIVSQAITWTFAPTNIVEINVWDHVARMAIYILIILLSVLVNKLYVSRLRENMRQIELQKLIGKISSEFVSARLENYEKTIISTLSQLGEFYDLSCISVVLFDYKNKNIVNANYWLAKDYRGKNTDYRSVSFEKVEWWLSQILNNDIISINSLEKIPEKFKSTRDFLLQRNVKSILAIPILNQKVIFGFISFEDRKAERNWDDITINSCSIIANIIGDTLSKMESESIRYQLAYYDSLTGFPNRTMCNMKLQETIKASEQSGNKFALYFLDLDDFKVVNDTVGHESGDYLLKHVSTKVKECFSDEDIVARYGGDELLIIQKNITSRKDAFVTSNVLMTAFDKAVILKNYEFNNSASVGIVIYPDDGTDAETLLKHVDIAMYEAKKNGKNQCVYFNDELKARGELELKLSNHLFKAIENKELTVVYQPQVDSTSEEIVGVEALIRWKNSELGIISPSVFIPIAEKVGLINSIGEWVMRTAINQNKEWQDLGIKPIRMAVNISVNQFKSSNLLAMIKNLLSESKLDAKYLEIELTENVIIEEIDDIIDTLDEVKKLGLSIAIDDFGTGYSSLSRLKELPIDKLKLDIEFVQNMGRSKKDKAIVEVIINLANQLELNVIAEGVETKKQFDELCNMKCKEIQGYYFYKPMHADDMLDLLTKDKSKNIG
ncbi:MAG: EAL domain-containing protein [Acidaminobacteraceae bacterium]